MIKAAVLGYGNIGSGVVQVLLRNKELIKSKAGEEIVPVKVLDLREFPGDVMEKKVVHDIKEISDDPEIKIVVETMGGTKPVYEFVKACLKAGKHVATSNKALVAAHGDELLKIAKERHVNFLFEASVGGGIPVIRPLTNSITADSVREITGILNGTTNYILTKMTDDGADYDAVLKDAQEKGFAERDPSADVEGWDACRKIAILASMAFGHFADYNDIETKGITEISADDIAYAKALGKKIKLFGSCIRAESGDISARVCPVMIGKEHPLYAVDGVMNAILVRGDLMGDLMFYGPGAGKYPTACAVVEDVITAAKNPNGTEIEPFEDGRLELKSDSSSLGEYYVRIKGTCSSKAKEDFKANTVLSDIRSGEFALVTDGIEESAFKEACTSYEVLNTIRLAR